MEFMKLYEKYSAVKELLKTLKDPAQIEAANEFLDGIVEEIKKGLEK